MKQFSLLALSALALGMASCAPASSTVSNARVVELKALNKFANGADSTAKGTAELSLQADGKTKVVVIVSGLTANTKHIGHIHTGTCTPGGPVALLLSELSSDASGNAKAETVVDTAKIPASAYVQYHQRGTGAAEGAGAGITCGDIK
jgi:CHRD domain